MKWLSSAGCTDELGVLFDDEEVEAFSSAFEEWWRKRTAVTGDEFELELVWAQIHANAADGISGTIKELQLTAGMLSIFGSETAEALLERQTGSDNTETEALRLGVQPRLELGGVAARMAMDIGEKIGRETPVDTTTLVNAFYADFLRQPVQG